MRRADFMYTLGYQGETAIVDRRARRRNSSLSIPELLEKGLFKPAFCAALFDASQQSEETDAPEITEDLKIVLEKYNSHSKAALNSVEQMKRVFGVFGVPDNVRKVIAL